MRYQAVATPRLLMEAAPTDEASLREMVGWLNNPLITRYSEQRHHHHTIESQLNYINMFLGEDFLLAIYHEELMIGTVSVTNDLFNNVANVGIMIGDSSKWGQGLGHEAWAAVCEVEFADGRRKIEAGCMECNIGMMNICSRYGMSEEGRLQDHFLCRGQPVDLVYWGKLK